MHITTLFERPDAPMEEVVVASWPAWMFGAEAADLLGTARRYPEHQVLLYEGDALVAVGNSVPLAALPDELPDTGWDWAIAQATPGPFRCALAVSVLPGQRGRGHSRRVLKAFGPCIVPVRPTTLQGTFADHVRAERADGLPVDPWLRTHVRLGGRIERVCSRSMTLRADPADWARWDTSTLLAEVDADGVYVEPNVWVRHGGS